MKDCSNCIFRGEVEGTTCPNCRCETLTGFSASVPTETDFVDNEKRRGDIKRMGGGVIICRRRA